MALVKLTSKDIENTKLFVNRPRYDRGRMSRDNKRNIFTQRVVVPQKETKRIYPADRKRSYVEVVREEKEDVGGLFRKGEPSKGSARPMQRTATLCSHQETNEWLQKAWVGRLKNRGMFERVEEELQWMLDGEVTPCYWIDDVDGLGGDTCYGGLKKVVEGRC